MFKVYQLVLKCLKISYTYFFKIYADNTVLVAESPEELQNTIDSFHFYCKRWNLR